MSTNAAANWRQLLASVSLAIRPAAATRHQARSSCRAPGPPHRASVETRARSKAPKARQPCERQDEDRQAEQRQGEQPHSEGEASDGQGEDRSPTTGPRSRGRPSPARSAARTRGRRCEGSLSSPERLYGDDGQVSIRRTPQLPGGRGTTYKNVGWPASFLSAFPTSLGACHQPTNNRSLPAPGRPP